MNLTGTARYYRDGAGRVRVEQPLPDDASKPGERPLVWVVIHNPDVGRAVVANDPRTGELGWLPTDPVADCIGGGHTFAVPLGYAGKEYGVHCLVLPRPLDYYDVRTLAGVETKEEALGERMIEGVTTVGHRTVITIPAGAEGSSTPVELIDERWESPELRLLVYSRVSDSRTGTIEYRLTNVRRGAPPASLFAVDRPPTGSRRVGLGTQAWGNPPWK